LRNAPFGDHKGPIVQSGGAFFGHWPPISLKTKSDEKHRHIHNRGSLTRPSSSARRYVNPDIT
jgi:hypothetical protein